MIKDSTIDRAFQIFNTHKTSEFVVSPSIPILYFGDMSEYEDSKFKVITVGKNPSDNEFRLSKSEAPSFCRFPEYSETPSSYRKCLDSYFDKTPLKQWFSAFEPVLNGLDCSYYKDRNFPNRAIHTDLCSPLATTPTWSNLSRSDQDILFTDGLELWKQLVEDLQPDLILISVPAKLFSYVKCTSPSELVTFKNKKDGAARKKAYTVYSSTLTLNSGKECRVVSGAAANKPFDTISSAQKLQIGQQCLG